MLAPGSRRAAKYRRKIRRGVEALMARDRVCTGLGKHNPSLVCAPGIDDGRELILCNRSKTYGIFNIKWLYISHVITFETGSALCGGAPSMNALIVGRAIA